MPMLKEALIVSPDTVGTLLLLSSKYRYPIIGTTAFCQHSFRKSVAY
jgi:hypothetical protein